MVGIVFSCFFKCIEASIGEVRVFEISLSFNALDFLSIGKAHDFDTVNG